MAFLSILLGVAVAVTGSSAGGLASGPEPREPIRVFSNSYEINFPDEVVFELEAAAETEITEVTLFYHLGRKDIRIYGYPQFTPAKRVTASFKVRTSGANYIPNGVDIAYYYVIRDARGHIFESPVLSFEYKDPAYDWQRLSLGDLVILWHDRPRDSVSEVATDVNQRLGAVKELLGLVEIRPMKAVILNSAREASRSFPDVSEAARRGHLYGGFAFGELDVFLLAGLNRNGIVHEMTHLLIDEALDSPLARIPAWLNEGVAMYFESGSSGRETIVSRAARGGRLLPLRGMGAVPGRPQEVRLFYAQSWSVVKHMMDAYGPAPMAALFRAINEGKGVEEAILLAYGMSVEQLETEWKAKLGGGSAIAPITDPGALGTSVLIAGAVAVALISIVVRWLRRVISSPNAESADL